MVKAKFTPFMLYCCEHRQKVLDENEDATDLVLGQILAQQWQQSALGKRKEGSKVQALATSPKKKKQRDRNAPKQASSAYMFFNKEQRPLIKEEQFDVTFAELGQRIGAMWKALTPEEKQKYDVMAVGDKQRFASEMAVYRQAQQASATTAAAEVSRVCSAATTATVPTHIATTSLSETAPKAERSSSSEPAVPAEGERNATTIQPVSNRSQAIDPQTARVVIEVIDKDDI